MSIPKRQIKIPGGRNIDRSELMFSDFDRGTTGGWDSSTGQCGIPQYDVMIDKNARTYRAMLTRRNQAKRRSQSAGQRGYSSQRSPYPPRSANPRTRAAPPANPGQAIDALSAAAHGDVIGPVPSKRLQLEQARKFAMEHGGSMSASPRRLSDPQRSFVEDRHKNLEQDLIDHIESCWSSFGIPECHRTAYRAKYFYQGIHPNVLLQEADALAHGQAPVEEKFGKYFGCLARCEGKFLYIDPNKLKFWVKI